MLSPRPVIFAGRNEICGGDGGDESRRAHNEGMCDVQKECIWFDLLCSMKKVHYMPTNQNIFAVQRQQ